LKKKLLDNPAFTGDESRASLVATALEKSAYAKQSTKGIYQNAISAFAMNIVRATKQNVAFDLSVVLKKNAD
jgi:hypothetical protein